MLLVKKKKKHLLCVLLWGNSVRCNIFHLCPAWRDIFVMYIRHRHIKKKVELARWSLGRGFFSSSTNYYKTFKTVKTKGKSVQKALQSTK